MKVMERIGLHTGHFNVEASRFAELVRISGVGYKATENVKILHAQKKVMTMSITRIIGQGCIKYTFCTIYFRLYINIYFIMCLLPENQPSQPR